MTYFFHVSGIAVLVILIAAAVIFLALFLVAGKLLAVGGKREPPAKYTVKLYYDAYQDRYPRKEVTFPSGDHLLHGFIYGEENTKALLVLAHGAGGFHEDYLTDITWFVDHGYRVFAADFTGCGYSEGDRSLGLNYSAIEMDVILSYIEQEPQLSDMRKVLYGHSWSAYGVAASLNYDHDVTAAASIASFASPAEELAEVGKMGKKVLGKILYAIFWLQFFRRNGKYGNLTTVKGINRSNIPVLVVHGTGDRIIPFDTAATIAKRDQITNPKTEYLVYDEEGCNDHDSFFHTREANLILNDLLEKRLALVKKFGGQIPEEEERVLFEGLDREMLNAPNQEFYEKVDAFFSRALAAE